MAYRVLPRANWRDLNPLFGDTEMLYIRADFYEFTRAFVDTNRYDSFSGDARHALFEYLWDLSEETGEPIEVCPIALCGQFADVSYTDFETETGTPPTADLQGDECGPYYVIAVLPASVLVEHI